MMTDINQHALEEIRANIKSGDLIKARLVLDKFDSIEAAVQRRILLELNSCADEVALPLLTHIYCAHKEVAKQYPTILEIISDKARNSPKVVRNNILEPVASQICFIELAAKLRLSDISQDLIQLLSSTDKKGVIQAAIAALGQIGASDSIKPVTDYLYSDDNELTKEAIHALAKIETEESLHVLADFLQVKKIFTQIILDIFVSIDSRDSLAKLNDCLLSDSAQIRSYAKSKLATAGKNALPLLTSNLTSKDADFLIHTLNVLQDIGDPDTDSAVRTLLNNQPADPNVRFAAYEALADISNRKGDYTLAGGLLDPDSNVRMAVARALNSIINETLVSGIRQMVRKNNDETRIIARSILDALAAKIFIALIQDQPFKEIALDYLIYKSHHDVRTFFSQALLEEGNEELAESILDKSLKTAEHRLQKRVCAVDDSRMVLNVYRSSLTELGYESILFQLPREAIDWLDHEKPDFVCTDLNMPEITGYELTKRVRQKYSKEELPIILVTTQGGEEDNKAAFEAGVNAVLSKPFTAAKLKECLDNIR